MNHKHTKLFAFALTAFLTACTQTSPLAYDSYTNNNNNNNSASACTNPTGTLTLLSPATPASGTLNVALNQSVVWTITMSCAGSYTATRNGVIVGGTGFSQTTTFTTTYSTAQNSVVESVLVSTSSGTQITLYSPTTFNVGGTASTALAGCALSAMPNNVVLNPWQNSAQFQLGITNSGTTSDSQCNFTIRGVAAVDQNNSPVFISATPNSGSVSPITAKVQNTGELNVKVTLADAANPTSTNTLTLVTPVTVSQAPGCTLTSSAKSITLGQKVSVTMNVTGSVSGAQILEPVTPTYTTKHLITASGQTKEFEPLVAINHLYVGQVLPLNSSTPVECSTIVNVVPPNAPTCSIVASADNQPFGTSISYTLSVTSGSATSTSLLGAVFGPTGGTRSIGLPVGNNTIAGSVTGPGGTGTCSIQTVIYEEVTEQPPRCGACLIQFCSQSLADKYCRAGGYARASAHTKDSGSNKQTSCVADMKVNGSTLECFEKAKNIKVGQDVCKSITCIR